MISKTVNNAATLTLAALLGAALCSPAALGATNKLPDGFGFETGPDGWDVMPHYAFQDPADTTTSYPRGWRMATAVADTALEGDFCLALEGGPTLQYHDVRWAPVLLEANTDYTFSAYLKVESDYYGGGCGQAGFGASFAVTNGFGTALTHQAMRDHDSDLTTCFERIYFHFNTADIQAGNLHPRSMYGFRLTIDTTQRSPTDTGEYTVYVDAVQLEKSAAPSAFLPPKPLDVGLDVIPAAADAPVAERALRHYKLFEESEALEFRCWVYARPGSQRPRGVGVRVEDAALRNADGSPLVLVERLRLSDPGQGVAGNFTLDHADLEAGSGIYRIVFGAPLEDESEELVFGVLHPAHPAAAVPAADHQFGVQLGNFKYLHRLVNEDGDPNNDRPECDGAETGDPECTVRVLYALGPDPNLPLWMIERLGIPHLRVKHVFHPKGYAPTDSLNGTWDLSYVERFVDTVNQYQIGILGMTGDDLHEVENLAAKTVNGYPGWMSPDLQGWQAFCDGHLRAYQELAATLGNRVEAYEVFNEPTSIRNSMTAAKLAQLDQGSSDVIANAGLDVQVVGFGLTGMGPRGVNAAPDFPQGRDALFGEFIELGGLNAMDVAAMHVAVTSEIEIYPDSLYNHGLEMRLAYCARALKTEIDRLIEVGDPTNEGFPFWVTETSFLSGSVYPKFDIPGASDVGTAGRRVDPHREVARLMAQEFVNFVASGWQRAYYFNFDATLFVGVNNGVFRSLVDVYGSPRTALGAFYNVSQNLAGATFVERFESDAIKRVFLKFERGSDDIIVAYSLDAHFPDLPFQLSEPAIYVSMWGKQVINPELSPDPIFIHGPDLDLFGVASQIEEQAAAARAPLSLQDSDDPTLTFDHIPWTGKYQWDFECASHLWLGSEPNPEDLNDRYIQFIQRFTDGLHRQMVPQGELFQGYTDEIDGVSTSVHSGETLFLGSDLLNHYGSLSEQVAALIGEVEQYLVISERGGINTGVYLYGCTDTTITQDPRYHLPLLDPAQVDLVERRLNVPAHQVDLVELLTEKGYLIDPAKEYLVDLVSYAVGDGAVFGIDAVYYHDGAVAREEPESAGSEGH